MNCFLRLNGYAFLGIVAALSFQGCSTSYSTYLFMEPSLASISIVDRNGFSETISNQDRLRQYEGVDFLSNHPYQKVLRIYQRDREGNIHAYITSYHPNGQPKQYLEISNHRASGSYQEWHPNGIHKLSAWVIGGEPDIDPSSQRSWLFEGSSQVWDDAGHLIAEIPYAHGELEGTSHYYHLNGAIWKKIPFCKNLQHGTEEWLRDNGTLFQKIDYCRGVKHGPSFRYWTDNRLAAEETYHQGLLQTAVYYLPDGEIVGSIKDGKGTRVLFGKDAVCELQEYQHGIQEGQIKLFAENGILVRIYHMKNELKDGEEVEYYPLCSADVPQQPSLLIQWSQGNIQGVVKTWYPNGVQESQREMNQNKKDGILTAWFEDGSLMMIERYEQDKLMEGQYFLRGEKSPFSEIYGGKGTATLFDSRGNIIKKVQYHSSKPIEE